MEKNFKTIMDIYGISADEERQLIYEESKLLADMYEIGKKGMEISVDNFGHSLAEDITKDGANAMKEHYERIIECAIALVEWTSVFAEGTSEEEIKKTCESYVKNFLGFSVKKVDEKDGTTGFVFLH